MRATTTKTGARAFYITNYRIGKGRKSFTLIVQRDGTLIYSKTMALRKIKKMLAFLQWQDRHNPRVFFDKGIDVCKTACRFWWQVEQYGGNARCYRRSCYTMQQAIAEYKEVML